LKIYITKELKLNLYRWRFTLAHEVGHLILHEEILKEYFGENIDIEKTLSLTGKFPAKTNKFMEIQANKFASMLLLPEKPLLTEVGKYFTEQNINKGYLYVDHQRVNQTALYNLLARLKEKFEVSNEVSRYRLASFGLLQGETMMSVKDILQNN
jgi:Zn-dependent peptidase ImmA (M78 family)